MLGLVGVECKETSLLLLLVAVSARTRSALPVKMGWGDLGGTSSIWNPEQRSVDVAFLASVPPPATRLPIGLIRPIWVRHDDKKSIDFVPSPKQTNSDDHITRT
jgi:hypothetical protein